MIHTDGKPTVCAPPRPEPERDADVYAKRTLDILIEEITPNIVSGKLTSPEHVLGVLIKVRSDYDAGT